MQRRYRDHSISARPASIYPKRAAHRRCQCLSVSQCTARRRRYHHPFTCLHRHTDCHLFPVTRLKRVSVSTMPLSPTEILDRTSPSPFFSYTSSLFPPPISPLISQRTKINRGTYVSRPSPSNSEEEDEGAREPSFKLHAAKLRDVPRMCSDR
ncbi:uncharacterized protein EV420DRAFT_1180890 [Desarmillaria tabescens]|uniref:Uncharacterized protein n=1 Tax=Armillaria tabescens TaxID=1929756 RepID=A0AA39NB53_ARMTA|nr:uncharacterized protein EV420DRAFT_1180890 [Desarmillaria tabescens]KAK0462293.1 hypothetical protein EV420DRAFT_1180890 [Desarmillaria tabescens]